LIFLILFCVKEMHSGLDPYSTGEWWQNGDRIYIFGSTTQCWVVL